jgi:hypothetical protein
MRFALSFFFYMLFTIGIGVGFFYALSSTLTDLTRRDCSLGVPAACEQLQHAGVQP